MPDVTLVVREMANAGAAERLERALDRLEFVEATNADPEKGLLAVSYEGGEAELDRIGKAIEEASYEYELPPGADLASD